MNHLDIDTSEPVTLIGGGEATREDLEIARGIGPACVAADGGAQLALDQGIPLEAVIGDMDSISGAARARIPAERFHPVAEQDSTDFDKALRHIRAPLIVAVGFTGGQIDHSLAALNTLVRRCERMVILLGQQDVVFLCPRVIDLPMPAGTRVSLFPMGPVRGCSNGLKWPIDGIEFAPGGRSGTSNQSLGDVHLEMSSAEMLCILPRPFMHLAAAQLLSVPAHARWPARAE
ncbi:MAG: thiamine diphosphokinase [Pseudomonadota bacterium]